MGDEKKRRGLSPVVASVLLILLVLVLAAIIFLWARGLLDEQIEKFGKPVEDYCKRVDFTVEEYDHFTVPYFEVINHGDVNINSLDVKMFHEGDSQNRRYNYSIAAGKYVLIDDLATKMDNGDPVEKIIFYPVLVGNVRGKSDNRPFTCMKEGVTINL